MGVYTKIFLKFPRKFWPTGPGKQFFVYASSRRGYYGMWQVNKKHNEDHYGEVEKKKYARC